MSTPNARSITHTAETRIIPTAATLRKTVRYSCEPADHKQQREQNCHNQDLSNLDSQIERDNRQAEMFVENTQVHQASRETHAVKQAEAENDPPDPATE